MKQRIALAFLTTTLLTTPVFAAEETIGETAQKNLDIIIYNNDRALVKDTRQVPVKQGANELAFSNISGQIIPASVLLKGNGIKFLENNFNYDVLSYESLLQKSVGETVTVEYMNPKTGKTEVNEAELLAINGITPILKINGKIDSSYPGRVLFNKIPGNLRAKPTLVMTVSSDKAAQQNLTLSYLTRGLSWDANYVAQMNPDNQTMTLNGWVSLTNNSGTDYKNANLQVVAGDVNLVPEYIARPRMMMKANMAMDGALMESAAGMAQENIADYHLYTLPRKTDILSNQTKQVSLLFADKVGIQKTYTFDNQLQPYNEIKQVKPRIEISFMNTKNNNLGIPLPRGVIRMYQSDKQGQMIFIGEDRINHTGNLEKVRLNMGTAFDISANAKQTKKEQIADNITEKTYEITLKNGTTSDVKVNIVENFSGTWKILSETQTSTKPTANQAKWILSVPAEGEAKLTYTVQEKLPMPKGRLVGVVH